MNASAGAGHPASAVFLEMHSFDLSSTPPTEFVAEVRDGLAQRGYDRHVTVSLDRDRLTIEFRWMGTTRFEYRIDKRETGFRAEFVGQRISPLHAAFSDRFEHYFEQALHELGAKVV